MTVDKIWDSPGFVEGRMHVVISGKNVYQLFACKKGVSDCQRLEKGSRYVFGLLDAKDPRTEV
jgi:hypothetical protein